MPQSSGPYRKSPMYYVYVSGRRDGRFILYLRFYVLWLCPSCIRCNDAIFFFHVVKSGWIRLKCLKQWKKSFKSQEQKKWGLNQFPWSKLSERCITEPLYAVSYLKCFVMWKFLSTFKICKHNLYARIHFLRLHGTVHYQITSGQKNKLSPHPWGLASSGWNEDENFFGVVLNNFEKALCQSKMRRNNIDVFSGRRWQAVTRSSTNPDVPPSALSLLNDRSPKSTG